MIKVNKTLCPPNFPPYGITQTREKVSTPNVVKQHHMHAITAPTPQQHCKLLLVCLSLAINRPGYWTTVSYFARPPRVTVGLCPWWTDGSVSDQQSAYWLVKIPCGIYKQTVNSMYQWQNSTTCICTLYIHSVITVCLRQQWMPAYSTPYIAMPYTTITT